MDDDLQLKLINSSISQGKNRWKWSVWIDGPGESLDQIDRVEYVLHPTFPDPVRLVTNRASNFTLHSKGWGEFMIQANVLTKVGRTIRLNHWLKLSGGLPVDPRAKRHAQKPSVFLSYSKADFPLAARLFLFLEKRGLEVLSDTQLKPDEPMNSAIKALIGRADALLALLAREPSSWVLYEISEAERQQIPVVPMLLGADAKLPTSLSVRQPLRIENPSDPREAERIIATQLSQLNL